MARAIVFSPSQEAIDRSLEARAYVNRLSKRIHVEHRDYGSAVDEGIIGGDVRSVAVLAGLSGLRLQSGYMEMEFDAIFKPREILEELRVVLPGDFPLVSIVDDVYSDYLMATYLRAGASVVVGTGGQLFGIVMSRVRGWDDIGPYINRFESL